MSITIRPTKHLVRVYELLIRTYGEPKNEPDYDPPVDSPMSRLVEFRMFYLS